MKPVRLSFNKTILSGLLFLVAAAGMPAQTVLFDTVALSEDGAPGTGGAEFSTFGKPHLNLSGDVAFQASLATGAGGTNGSNNDGIWLVRQGEALELVSRTGDAVPTSPSNAVQVSSLGQPVLDNLGNVAFLGRLEPSAVGGVHSANDEGIWITAGNSGTGVAGLSLLAREDDLAETDLDGNRQGRYGSLGQPTISGNGIVSFSGDLRDGQFEGGNGGWFLPYSSVTPGESEPAFLVAVSGEAAPGVSGREFQKIDLPLQGRFGEFAFRATTGEDESGIWLGEPGSLNLLAATGKAASGAPQGAGFFEVGLPEVNTSSVVAYWGGLTSEASPEGIWIYRSGDTELAVLAGEMAPGLPVGTVFDFFYDPVVNESASIAFLAYLKSDDGEVDENNNQSIWVREVDGSLNLRARSGDNAPGAPPGVRFDTLSSPTLNDLGQFGFTASLAADGDEVSSESDMGAWVVDRDGTLIPVLLEGDQLEFGGGDMRTVSALMISDINNKSQMAVTVDFSDGSSGVFSVDLPVEGADPPQIVSAPEDREIEFGETSTMSFTVSGSEPITYQWYEGAIGDFSIPIAGADGTTYTTEPLFETTSFWMHASNLAGSLESPAVTVAVPVTLLVEGSAEQVNFGTEFQGNTYNGFEMTGSTATFSSIPGEITRISFLDPDGDLAFAEFGGENPGTTLAITLDEFVAEVPSPYNQPGTTYVQGSAIFVVQNSTSATFFSVFSLGNDSARVDVSLINSTTFSGDVDGIADIKLIKVEKGTSGTTEIGGINAANANFTGSASVIGINAAEVIIRAFLFIGDIAPSGSAQPWIRLSADSTIPYMLITGGDFAEAVNSFQIDTDGIICPFPFLATEGQRSISNEGTRTDLGDGALPAITDTFVSNANAYFVTDGQNVGAAD